MINSGDSIRVVHPLFPEEDDGSIPISPLQFEIGLIPKQTAVKLNFLWHSRLPEIKNWHACDCYGALYHNRYYAVAMWSAPVARMLAGKGFWELRRMAISDDAPKNTASRMLKIMRKMIVKSRSDIVKFISYQDTEVHTGTIYKASGWRIGNISTGGEWNRPSRYARPVVAIAPKIRWEYDL